MKVSTRATSSLVFLAFCFGLLISAQSVAAELRVPEDYASIQAAVNAANNGDTVSVAPGTYNISQPISVVGKDIVMLGRDGSATTTLDANGANGILLVQNAGSSSAVSGFTFLDGQATESFQGGCLALRNARTSVTNNVFQNCASDSGNLSSSGGALKVTDDPNANIRSKPVIESNLFEGNRSYSQGGGIHVIGATAVIRNNQFTDNISKGSASPGGGAVKVTDSLGAPVLIENNNFNGNEASFAGGAVSVFNGSATIRSNTFIGNGRARFGGAIHLETASADQDFLVVDNTIENNFATNEVNDPSIRNDFDTVSGGGMHINLGAAGDTTSTLVITGNVIRGNSSIDSRCTEGTTDDFCGLGGGFEMIRGGVNVTVQVSDNRIENNEADIYGGAGFTRTTLVFNQNTVLSNRARYAYPGIACFNGDFSCTIESNVFHDNRYTLSGSPGVQWAFNSGALAIGNNEARVVNNQFSSNEGRRATVFLRDQSGSTAYVAFNTFADNETFESNFATLAIRTDAQVRNNIFEGDKRAIRVDTFTNDTALVRNNITGTSESIARVESDVYDTVAALNGISIASNNSSQPPSFKETNGNDYSLSESSALIDSVNCLAGITSDLLGTARPTGSACDPGAYEFYVDNTIFADSFET